MADSAPGTSAERQSVGAHHRIGMRRVAQLAMSRPATTNSFVGAFLLLTLYLAIATASPQQYTVCKEVYSHRCLAFETEIEEDVAGAKELYSDANFACYISNTKPYPGYQKIVTVAPFTESTRRLFCKSIIIMKVRELDERTLHHALGRFQRVRRDASYSPRGRYRGQTQSQYLAVDRGGGKDEGKAEAHSAADSSRATVSGNSGMGQAQSQSMYDPSCEECVGRTDLGVEGMKRRPGEQSGQGNLPESTGFGNGPSGNGGVGPGQILDPRTSGQGVNSNQGGSPGGGYGGRFGYPGGTVGFGPGKDGTQGGPHGNIPGANKNGALGPQSQSGYGTNPDGSSSGVRPPIMYNPNGMPNSNNNGLGTNNIGNHPGSRLPGTSLYGSGQPGLIEDGTGGSVRPGTTGTYIDGPHGGNGNVIPGNQGFSPGGASGGGNMPPGSLTQPHNGGGSYNPNQNVVPNNNGIYPLPGGTQNGVSGPSGIFPGGSNWPTVSGSYVGPDGLNYFCCVTNPNGPQLGGSGYKPPGSVGLPIGQGSGGPFGPSVGGSHVSGGPGGQYPTSATGGQYGPGGSFGPGSAGSSGGQYGPGAGGGQYTPGIIGGQGSGGQYGPGTGGIQGNGGILVPGRGGQGTGGQFVPGSGGAQGPGGQYGPGVSSDQFGPRTTAGQEGQFTPGGIGHIGPGSHGGQFGVAGPGSQFGPISGSGTGGHYSPISGTGSGQGSGGRFGPGVAGGQGSGGPYSTVGQYSPGTNGGTSGQYGPSLQYSPGTGSDTNGLYSPGRASGTGGHFGPGSGGGSGGHYGPGTVGGTGGQFGPGSGTGIGNQFGPGTISGTGGPYSPGNSGGGTGGQIAPGTGSGAGGQYGSGTGSGKGGEYGPSTGNGAGGQYGPVTGGGTGGQYGPVTGGGTGGQYSPGTGGGTGGQYGPSTGGGTGGQYGPSTGGGTDGQYGPGTGGGTGGQYGPGTGGGTGGQYGPGTAGGTGGQYGPSTGGGTGGQYSPGSGSGSVGQFGPSTGSGTGGQYGPSTGGGTGGQYSPGSGSGSVGQIGPATGSGTGGQYGPGTGSGTGGQYSPGTGSGTGGQYGPGTGSGTDIPYGPGTGIGTGGQYGPGTGSGTGIPYGPGTGIGTGGQFIPGAGGITGGQYGPLPVGGPGNGGQFSPGSGGYGGKFIPGGAGGGQSTGPGGQFGPGGDGGPFGPGAGVGQGSGSKFGPGSGSQYGPGVVGGQGSGGKFGPNTGDGAGGKYGPGGSIGGQYGPGTAGAGGQYGPDAGGGRGSGGQLGPGGQGTGEFGPQGGQYGPGQGPGTYNPYGTGGLDNLAGSGGNQNGVPQNVIDPNSIADGDDSEAEASVNQAANGTVASASSKGGNDKGRAQTHVQGTYTDSGTFSAQAEITGEDKAASSQVSGNKKSASSTAQGSGRKNKSQANVELGLETGSVVTGSQSEGILHSSNSQVQGSVKGGMADAQARGPGSTSSQAQIGFTPYKEGDKSHDTQKAPFVGGGISSAQSSGRTGMSQSQLHGTFKYGITYNGAAQAGSSLDKDAVFPNRLPFDKIDVNDQNNKNINVDDETIYNPEKAEVSTSMPPTESPTTELPFETDIVTELNKEVPNNQPDDAYGIHRHADHHTSNDPSLTPTRAPPVESRRSFQSTYNTNTGDYEYTTDKDENPPEDYDVDDGFGPEGNDPAEAEQGYINTNYNEFSRDPEPTHQSLHSQKRKDLEVRQTTGGNTQHILLGSLSDQDAEITQQNSERPDESRIYQPGERVPGTGGYTIPKGFTGSVKSVASKDKTYVIGSKESPSQAQTVSLTPGSGRVKYKYPPYARNVNPKNLRSLYNSKSDDNNRYVSVSKSVTRALDGENNVRKQYSHTYYTKSSSCGYFTFTCTMVSSAEGRKKVCKPKIPTNPDGSPMRCN